ncbi:MAG: hypothetical protein R2795_27195 [Saprospiraceae bacterium]
MARFWAIAEHHAPYKARWQWIATQIDQAPNGTTKMYLTEAQAPMDTLLMSWGTPYESLVISSAISGHQRPKTLLIHPDLQPWHDSFPAADLFIGTFATYPIESLNRRYFPLDATAYQPLSPRFKQ